MLNKARPMKAIEWWLLPSLCELQTCSHSFSITILCDSYSAMEASHNTLQSFEDELWTQPISISATELSRHCRSLQGAARCCEVLRGAARSSRPKGDQDQLRSACETFGFVLDLGSALRGLGATFSSFSGAHGGAGGADGGRVQCLDLARAREPKGNPTQEESTRKEKEEEETNP